MSQWPEYHKIQTVFFRNPKTNHKTLLDGHWSKDEFWYLKNLMWTATEKIDGMNIRVMFDGKEVTFAGKTDKAELHKDLVKRLTELFPTEKLAKLFPNGACLYGEGFGAGIQKGGCYSDTKDFILFDILTTRWWTRQGINEVSQELGIKRVAELCSTDLVSIIERVRNKELVSCFGDFLPEGVVARPLVELTNSYGERVITKLKCKDFTGMVER